MKSLRRLPDPVKPPSPVSAVLALPRWPPAACRQGRPGQGPGRVRPGLRWPATPPTAAAAAGQPDPAGPACRVPGQAAHRVQVGQARQRHHEGHGRPLSRRRHEERRRLLRQQGQARRSQEQGHWSLLGEKIYRGGIAAKQVPACAGCHSPAAPASRAVPAPGGQHADYTEPSWWLPRGCAPTTRR
jgi:hypothetical protein